MHTRESCLQKYNDFKLHRNGEIPNSHEFLEYAEIDRRELQRIFGASAYSKLQKLAGDVPNRFSMDRTPIDKIMKQYGELVIEYAATADGLPPSSEWLTRDLRPTVSGLSVTHKMKWSEMPLKFKEWATGSNATAFHQALTIIDQSGVLDRRNRVKEPCDSDQDFELLSKDVREWTAARRRNSEETYQVELRKHLEGLNYKLNEEFGESKYDLLVDERFAIEVKKDPDLGEYDRLFGQLARHLQHQRKVIVLIVDATRKDKYDNFTLLVDQYLNVGKNLIEVIKR